MMPKKATDDEIRALLSRANTTMRLRDLLAETWEAGFRAAQSMNFPDYDEPALFNAPWTDGDEQNPYREVGNR